MKKVLKYILILIILVEIFTPILSVQAAGGTCWSKGKIIGKTPDMRPEQCVSTGDFGCGISGTCHEKGVWQEDGQPAPPPPDGPTSGTAPHNKGTCWSGGVAINVYPGITPEECANGTMTDPRKGTWQAEGQPVPPPPDGPPTGYEMPQCSDGKDNDGDGAIDAVDPGCHSDGDATNGSSYDSEFNSEALRATIPYSPTSKYYFLEPITTSDGGGTGRSFDASDTNALAKYLNFMIKIFIGLCAVLAVIMMVIGGIEYMTSELVHSKEAGKSRMTNAIFGLIIALGAYALLYTINPDLLNTNIYIPVTTIGYADHEVPQTYDPVTKRYPGGLLYGAKWDDSVGAIPTLPASVSVKGPECTSVGQQNCTSTRGLDISVIELILAKCPQCKLMITGGTETWLHGGPAGKTAHGPKNPTIDLRAGYDARLDAFLSGGKPLVNMQRYPPPNGPMYETEGGNHWHIGP